MWRTRALELENFCHANDAWLSLRQLLRRLLRPSQTLLCWAPRFCIAKTARFVNLITLRLAMIAAGPWGRRVCQAMSLRDAGHAIVYHPCFSINPIPDAHRFPMPKDHLLWQRLVECGMAGRTFTPARPDPDTLCLVHAPAYVRGFQDGTLSEAAMRRIGLPWSQALVARTLVGVGSAVLAARLALQFGVAAMCNGGTHHAHLAHGSGWCVFNDLAVAARAAQRDAGARRVMLVDLDVHQGDGSAAIFAGDPSGESRSALAPWRPGALALRAPRFCISAEPGCPLTCPALPCPRAPSPQHASPRSARGC